MILPNDEGDYVENVVDLDGYDHLAIAPGSDATAPKENLVSCFFFHTRTRLAASKLHRHLLSQYTPSSSQLFQICGRLALIHSLYGIP